MKNSELLVDEDIRVCIDIQKESMLSWLKIKKGKNTISNDNLKKIKKILLDIIEDIPNYIDWYNSFVDIKIRFNYVWFYNSSRL